MIATSQVDPAGHLISKIIPFSKDLSFERLRPITDLRKDDGEARVLYICRKIFTSPDSGTDNREYVMKIKIQVPKPGGIAEALPGPSDITKAELQALELFKKAEIPNLPHLEAWTGQVQGPDGLLPGGYISFTVMNLLPGSTIWDLNFWGLPEEERDEIRALALKVLQGVWALGIGPYDCALRNIMWDRSSRKCSIIDFEYWRPIEGLNIPSTARDFETELQRWGLIRRPAAATNIPVSLFISECRSKDANQSLAKWVQEWGFNDVGGRAA